MTTPLGYFLAPGFLERWEKSKRRGKEIHVEVVKSGRKRREMERK